MRSDVDNPPGGPMDQPWLASAADVDGRMANPELLLPLCRKNFVRAVVLEPAAKDAGSTNAPGWTFRVKDHSINGAATDSHITGATSLVNGTNAIPSIFLMDADNKQLTLCEPDKAGVWQVVERHGHAPVLFL